MGPKQFLLGTLFSGTVLLGILLILQLCQILSYIIGEGMIFTRGFLKGPPPEGSPYFLVLPDPIDIADPTADLPSEDWWHLLDLRDFSFIQDNDLCEHAAPLLLVLIVSAPGNFARRRLIRETWGARFPEVKFLYLLGSSREHDADIRQEGLDNGDMLQGNFEDTYYNLTYKHAMALKWITYKCQGAKYVLKVDDDVFVSIPRVLHFLRYSISPHGARRFLFCAKLNYQEPPIRSRFSKWRVTRKEYPDDVYPNFCSGWAVMYSVDTVFALYRQVQHARFFKLEDVLITGILAQKANLVPVTVSSLILNSQQLKDVLKSQSPDHNFMIGPHPVSDSDLRLLHELTLSKNR